jgi:salicylate biosynthesis isochorismate synthase
MSESSPGGPGALDGMNAALLTDCALQFCSAAIEVDPLPPERLLACRPTPRRPSSRPTAGPGWAWAWPAGCPPAREAAALWAGLLDESADLPEPMALGALPFDPHEVPDALWQGLMPGGLMLPEALYQQQDGRAWWRLTLPVRDVGCLPRRLAQARRRWPGWRLSKRRPFRLDALARRRFAAGLCAAVGAAVQRIRQGELVKVVLARRGAVDFDSAPAAAALLARLGNATRAVCAMPGAAAARPGWAPRPRRWCRCRASS